MGWGVGKPAVVWKVDWQRDVKLCVVENFQNAWRLEEEWKVDAPSILKTAKQLNEIQIVVAFVVLAVSVSSFAFKMGITGSTLAVNYNDANKCLGEIFLSR